LATVPHIDKSITDLAASTKSELGTGGMRSKLRAARLATAAGESVVMANGSIDGILDQIFASRAVGTLFLPHGRDVPAWKRWLGFTARPKGTVRVDAGARQALLGQGKSLLLVGVIAVEGEFGKGDVVAIYDDAGAEIARGLCNYASKDVARLRGLSSEQIARVLGMAAYPELVHRDNLVVVG
jgi:glutamate 5-kinase